MPGMPWSASRANVISGAAPEAAESTATITAYTNGKASTPRAIFPLTERLRFSWITPHGHEARRRVLRHGRHAGEHQPRALLSVHDLELFDDRRDRDAHRGGAG